MISSLELLQSKKKIFCDLRPFSDLCAYNISIRSGTGGVHCDKYILRSGNTPCYSWEHFQLQQGNIQPAQIPATARFFPSYSWKLSQLCFLCNCWYISQVQPGYCPRFNLVIVPGSTWLLSQVQPAYCPRFNLGIVQGVNILCQ